jgi:hypothetical protein
MLSGNPYDRVEFRRKLQGETLMSEGIMPGYPEEYHSTAPRFTHRGFSLVLNPASTLKIIWTRFLLSCISRFAERRAG